MQDFDNCLCQAYDYAMFGETHRNSLVFVGILNLSRSLQSKCNIDVKFYIMRWKFHIMWILAARSVSDAPRISSVSIFLFNQFLCLIVIRSPERESLELHLVKIEVSMNERTHSSRIKIV